MIRPRKIKGCLATLAITWIGLIISPAWAQVPRERVRQELQAVNGLLDEFPEARESWETYLKLPALRSQLELGPQADGEVVADIAGRFGGRDVSVPDELLVGVDEALAAWFEQPTDAARTTSVQRALRSLNTWIRRNRSRASGWDDFFQLDRINIEVRKGADADLDWLRQIKSRLQPNGSYARQEVFDRLGRAVAQWQAELERPLQLRLALSAREAKAAYEPLPEERYDEARRALIDELNALDQFLQSGGVRKEQGWKNYLRWNRLRSEVEQRDRPRMEFLEESVRRFGGDAAGLDRRPFVRMQRALREFLDVLRFAESSPGRLRDQQRRVQQHLEQLDRFLAAGGETKQQGWKRFLRWNTWNQEIYADDPDPRAFYAAAVRLREEQPGLKLAPFRDLEAELGKYLELYQWNRQYSPSDDYVRRLETLARALDISTQDVDPGQQAQVLEQLLWLHRTGQATELVRHVRQTRARPNMYVMVTEELLARQIEDVVNQRSPVGRCFEGAWVSGTADTNARVTGHLVPAANHISLDILLQGTTFTNSVATQRRVQVYTHGNTLSTGRKRLIFDESGLRAMPAVATSSTRQSINAIQVNRRFGRRLITRGATRRAYEKKPRAERVANMDASQAIRQSMDQQANELIQNANLSYQTRVVQPLKKNDLYPDQLQLSSSDTHLFVQALVAPGETLGPAQPMPPVPSGYDLAANLHQTAVNNILAEYLGDVNLSSEQMQALMERFNIPQPEPVTNADGEVQEPEEWSITFDHLQPATVKFDDQIATISIVGRRFTRGNDEILDRIRIGASYRVEWNDTEAILVRVGDVEVEFVDIAGRLSNEQLAYKTFLRNQVEPMFRPRISTTELPDNEAAARLAAFQLKALSMDAGWVSAGLGVDTTKLEGLGLK